MQFRAAFSYDADAVSRESGLRFDVEEDMCQQQFLEECDINTLVKRFGLTGTLPQNVAMPLVGDFTEVVDFHTAQNLVIQSQEEFMKLPADVRKRFGNNPGAVLEFLDDVSNRDEAIKLGLIPAPPEVTRTDDPK